MVEIVLVIRKVAMIAAHARTDGSTVVVKSQKEIVVMWRQGDDLPIITARFIMHELRRKSSNKTACLHAVCTICVEKLFHRAHQVCCGHEHTTLTVGGRKNLCQKSTDAFDHLLCMKGTGGIGALAKGARDTMIHAGQQTRMEKSR